MPAIWTFAKVKPEKENQTNGIRELGPDPPPLLEQEKDDLLSLPPPHLEQIIMVHPLIL